MAHLLYLDNLTLTDSPLGVEKLNPAEERIIFYPNPTGGELEIKNNSAQSFQLFLYNYLGKEIVSIPLTNKISRVDLSSCPDGVYFYKLTSGKDIIKTGKILKQ